MAPPRRMLKTNTYGNIVHLHGEDADCASFGCVPVDTAPQGPLRPTSQEVPCLTVFRGTLAYYQDFFGVDPAALPALEGQTALATVVQIVRAAQAVVDAYHAVCSMATLGALNDAVHALAAVLREEETP